PTKTNTLSLHDALPISEQIVSLYSSVNRGIQNYYRFADNWGQLNRIQYILQCSLAKTLARKYQFSMTKVFKRFGKQMTIQVAGKDRKSTRLNSSHSQIS